MNSPRYRALLVGNANYPRDAAALPALHGPLIDLEKMRQALTEPAIGLFAPDEVRALADVGVQQAREELDGFFSHAARDEVLLLYYSGHGRLDERGRLYLCAADTLTTGVRATALSAMEITNMIEGSAASAVVIVLDCCHSGAFKTAADLATSVSGRGRYVLTSNRSSQLARAAAAPGQPSPFTALLVRGLREAEATGCLTVAELYQRVHRWMLAEQAPLAPQLRFVGEGDLIIAGRPGPIPSTPLSVPAPTPAPAPTPVPTLAPAPVPEARPESEPVRPAVRERTTESSGGGDSRAVVRYRLYDPVYHRRVSIASFLMGACYLIPSVVVTVSDVKAGLQVVIGMTAIGMGTLRLTSWLLARQLIVSVTDSFLRVSRSGRPRDYSWAEISKVTKAGEPSGKRAMFKLYDASGELVESTPLPTLTRTQWADFTAAVHEMAPHITVQDRHTAR